MTSEKTVAQRRATTAIGATAALIGWLTLVELTSGILQGYYVPLISDIVKHLGIHDADYNWFEAAQLLLSALVVPVLAKLGDMFGHKRILLVATVLTALASWALAFSHDFTTYLIAFALQGFYVVWLPLEIALIFDRGRRTGTAASRTRRAAGLLVVALEAGAIVGASRPEQVESNAKAAGVELDEAVLARIDEAILPVAVTDPSHTKSPESRVA